MIQKYYLMPDFLYHCNTLKYIIMYINILLLVRISINTHKRNILFMKVSLKNINKINK